MKTKVALIQLTLTETKPHIKTKAVLIIDFDLVITVSPAGYIILLIILFSISMLKMDTWWI